MHLSLSINGKHLDVTDRTKPKHIRFAWGDPSKSWNDGVEECLEYESEHLSVSFIFGVDYLFFKTEGKLKSVDVEQR